MLTTYGRAFEHPCKIRFVRWLVRALAGGRITMRHAGGAVIAVDPQDYIGWAIFRSGSYEPASLALALKIMSAEPGLFVDVGANFGWYTCAVASIAGVKVIGIEPDPENCAALRAISLATDCAPSWSSMARSARNRSCWQCPGDRRAIPERLRWLPAARRREAAATGPDRRRSKSPHALVQPPARPVLIKIDVEGFEPEVLKGLDFAGPFRPKNIMIECDRALGAAAWGSYEKFAAFFTQRGYEVLDVTGRPFTGDGPLLEENAWARDRDQAR